MFQNSLYVVAAFVIVGGLAIVQHRISRQLDIIHDLVNSNLTRVTADLRVAETRIETLEAQILADDARA